jgi:NAD-dependent deacetylase
MTLGERGGSPDLPRRNPMKNVNDLPLDDLIAQARQLVTHASSISVLTGAGISAESGVPTYRGSGGLWRGIDAQDVASPEGFRRDPRRVWQWHNERRMALKDVRPNAGHAALARLQLAVEARGGRFVLATQNVDGLHQAAGSRSVLELHGSILASRCSVCDERREIGSEPVADLPRCSKCGRLMRPAIVWFGETLPEDAWLAAAEAAATGEVFLTVGTSAVVYPAAGLIEIAAGAGARTIEVNLEPTAASTRVGLALRGKAGDILPRIVE